ncbi:Rhodanese-like protein [Cordyceps fumosorosea ARSEF 2679]|uniref:Rhodanese-like protein n=1 Tax=Cordyceps fumosorosea (strain ARSEF 2679) TaxID=1081104 RepID=A0A167R755_CORFA|nr:Rhodanese-like protein [Cordyceps fumosorosea ARSEF 2679]OAA58335.1 Rhodanese-like protein [Cordyceps fumosorosea ARSEF 2679]
MASIATLKRISAKDLADRILAEQGRPEQTYAIVDVRDDDHLGGHIKGGIHAASAQLEAMMPTLLRRLGGKKTVVFHCMLSQQRGPSAALRYLRERQLQQAQEGKSEGEDGQEVLVLENGFEGWRQQYGSDERLTEGYRKELWENY